jgi:hypothetical protein
MHEINGCGDYLFAVCDFAPHFVFLSQLGFSTILALHSWSNFFGPKSVALLGEHYVSAYWKEKIPTNACRFDHLIFSFQKNSFRTLGFS